MTPHDATELVRRLIDDSLTVTGVRPLTGGMVNRVLELAIAGPSASIVAKVSSGDHPADFRGEYNALAYHREHGTLPVPTPLAVAEAGEAFEGSCLLLEKVPGRHLKAARLTREGLEHYQRQLADRLAHLHDHTRDRYGPAWRDEGYDRWLGRFEPMIRANFDGMADRFEPGQRRAVAWMLDRLDEWLGEFHRPTLIHGDLWATNIMLDDADPDRPTITAFLDGGADFSEVEYELAYLLVFETASETFFDAYQARHPLREEFGRRAMVYWINTIMLHVRLFGDEYLPRCKRLAEAIARMG
jgi:fructosamine-3-kinase